uniref:Uncharacterized protein n=1 Tax=Octopus bimaculoides TaxID=37653 RepID=A0A0L8H0A1_OCTBM
MKHLRMLKQTAVYSLKLVLILGVFVWKYSTPWLANCMKQALIPEGTPLSVWV